MNFSLDSVRLDGIKEKQPCIVKNIAVLIPSHFILEFFIDLSQFSSLTDERFRVGRTSLLPPVKNKKNFIKRVLQKNKKTMYFSNSSKGIQKI